MNQTKLFSYIPNLNIQVVEKKIITVLVLFKILTPWSALVSIINLYTF